MVTKAHDLEFHVSPEGSYDTEIFHNFDKAAAHAVAVSCSRGVAMHIDVVTWTKAAARKWGGATAVEIYEADPEASSHERIVITATSIGHVA